VLPAGTYSFNVADGTLDVVVVRTSAGTKQLYMGFTTTSAPTGRNVAEYTGDDW
jgi:hypothetical protein